MATAYQLSLIHVANAKNSNSQIIRQSMSTMLLFEFLCCRYACSAILRSHLRSQEACWGLGCWGNSFLCGWLGLAVAIHALSVHPTYIHNEYILYSLTSLTTCSTYPLETTRVSLRDNRARVYSNYVITRLKMDGLAF